MRGTPEQHHRRHQFFLIFRAPGLQRHRRRAPPGRVAPPARLSPAQPCRLPAREEALGAAAARSGKEGPWTSPPFVQGRSAPGAAAPSSAPASPGPCAGAQRRATSGPSHAGPCCPRAGPRRAAASRLEDLAHGAHRPAARRRPRRRLEPRRWREAGEKKSLDRGAAGGEKERTPERGRTEKKEK
jgi:hypothetical protein